MNNDQNSIDLQGFVDKLILEKQLPDLDDEVITQMKSDLLSRVEDRINAALITNMNPDQLEEFNNLMEKNDEVEIQAYLKQAIPDLETVIATALINFRATYLGLNA